MAVASFVVYLFTLKLYPEKKNLKFVALDTSKQTVKKKYGKFKSS